jgi:hypothetical protein
MGVGSSGSDCCGVGGFRGTLRQPLPFDNSFVPENLKKAIMLTSPSDAKSRGFSRFHEGSREPVSNSERAFEERILINNKSDT